MALLRVAPEKTFFLCDNQPFFYLADTCWSAFTNITLKEWEEYLDYRKLQGFNALQINVLAQWDTSLPYLYFPFKRDSQGDFSSFELEEGYFDRAEKMLKMAKEKGFIPALVLIWCNYVPDTWGSERGISPVMPLVVMENYVKYVVGKFSKFEPIWIISGDTDFRSERAVDYYLAALQIVKSISPDALTTFHLSPSSDLPERIITSSLLDFYMYQSGHGREEQNLSYILAQHFYNKSVKRPVVNGEPCYEGHAYGGTKNGRFSAFDVRKAIWQSLLSGAKGGVTYGAHGIWSWHRRGKEFRGVEFSGEPFEWRDALRLEGAWDAGFAKIIFEEYHLFDLEPAQHLLLNSAEGIRIAKSQDEGKLAIYSPFADRVTLRFDLRGYKVLGVDLSRRQWLVPEVIVNGEISTIEMAPQNSDFLYLIWKIT